MYVKWGKVTATGIFIYKMFKIGWEHSTKERVLSGGFLFTHYDNMMCKINLIVNTTERRKDGSSGGAGNKKTSDSSKVTFGTTRIYSMKINRKVIDLYKKNEQNEHYK